MKGLKTDDFLFHSTLSNIFKFCLERKLKLERGRVASQQICWKVDESSEYDLYIGKYNSERVLALMIKMTVVL